ncbi:TPA: hypothetical protein DEP96_00530 [Candidatus Uhrbacteria bacterium]|nr:hypothetical protein [Candidatus Uhrbacteria bacterium]
MSKISFKIKSLWPSLAVLATMALGAILRVIPLMGRDFWYDEAFTGITVRQTWSQMMSIIVHDVHPPLYYILLKLWTLIASSSPLAIRSFSVILSVATIGLVYVALRQWYPKSPLPAILGSLVMAINPFFINYGQEARMYSLFAFLLALAAILLTKSWTSAAKTSTKFRLAFGLTLLAILLTHYLGFVFALAFVIADFAHYYRQQPTKFKTSKLTWLLSGYLAPLLGGLAWLPSYHAQTSGHASLGWVPNTTFDHLPTAIHIFLFGAPVGVAGVPPALGYRFDWLSIASISVILVVLITTLVVTLTLRKKWDANLALLGFITAFPLLAALALQLIHVQLFVERFLTGSALFLVLFLVLALSRLDEKFAILKTTVGIYILLVLAIQPYSYQPHFSTVAATINNLSPSSEVIATNPFDFILVRFYLGEQANLHLYLVPDANGNTEYVDGWALIADRASNHILSLPTSPATIIAHNPNDFPDYHTITTVNDLSLLTK